jgi:hypothetical protein
MDTNKISRNIPNYSQLFEKLDRKAFLDHIFINPRFAKTFSFFWKADLDNKTKQLHQTFTYFHEDDLYKYFEINHSFHKDKSKYVYTFALFHLLTDLYQDISVEEFVPLEDVYTSQPILIFNQSSKSIPELVNITRDLLYIGKSLREVRSEYGYNSKYFKQVLKKIYQEELLPLDITLA